MDPGGNTATFSNSRRVCRERQALLPSPVQMPAVSPLPTDPPPSARPPLRPWGGEGEKGPSKCLGRGRGTAAAARPYLGSRACPRRARRREAPAGAGRPRRARGRPRRRLPSRTASAAPRPAGLPPSAAPVGTALCPRTRPGMGPGPGPERGACGAPRAPCTVSGSDSQNRCPSSRRAQDALGRALFLAIAALPVGQTEPVNSAAGEGPAPGAPQNGSHSSAES